MRHTIRHSAAWAALLLLAGTASPVAQSPTPPAPVPVPVPWVQTLQQQNDQILAELKAIRQLLERLLTAPAAGAPAQDAHVVIASLPLDHVLGRPDAPLTIVEFTDLQCPFCRQFHVGAFEDLKREYIDTGKVRFITRDLPLQQIHPQALAAARASRCAGPQNKYWEMRHAILVNNTRLTPELFTTLARDLGLDVAAFSACTANTGPLDAAIRADVGEAVKAGINATPGFVIGRSQGNGVDGVRVSGALPFAAFDAALKQFLASQ